MKLTVNKNKLLSDLSLAFTDKYSPIREMMQNSKRAKATEINIEYAEGTGELAVSNNGEIIHNFQALLSVSTSGWSEEVKKHEKPYGLGFLAVLMSSEDKVLIESGDKHLVVDPKRLLAGEDIGEPISSDEGFVQGTCVTLKIKGLDRYKLQDLASVFDLGISVTLNGKEITRGEPDHVFELEGFGTLEITNGFSKVYSFTNEHRLPVAFQGFLTNGNYSDTSTYGDTSGIVVHLDQRKFDARLPDRATIVDFDSIKDELHREVNRVFFAELVLQPTDVILSCYTLLKRSNRMSILLDMDELAPEACYSPENLGDILLTNEPNSDYGCESPTLHSEGNVFHVDSLQVDRYNFMQYLSALHTGGTVCLYAGQTQPLSNEELGFPAYSDTSTLDLNGYLNAEDIDSASVVYYDGIESTAPFIMWNSSDSLFYVNTCEGTDFDEGMIQEALRCAHGYLGDNYELDWTALNQDVEVIMQALRTLVRQRNGEEQTLEQLLLEDIRRVLPDYKFPSAIEGQTITFTEED